MVSAVARGTIRHVSLALDRPRMANSRSRHERVNPAGRKQFALSRNLRRAGRARCASRARRKAGPRPTILDRRSRSRASAPGRVEAPRCRPHLSAGLYNASMDDTVLRLFEGSFAVCRLDKDAAVPDWATSGDLFSVTRTPDELSIVCRYTGVPSGIDCETGWRCLKIESPFEFDLARVISSIAAPLAETEVDMFMVVTQDSDYLMVKEPDLERTIAVASRAGYSVHT